MQWDYVQAICADSECSVCVLIKVELDDSQYEFRTMFRVCHMWRTLFVYDCLSQSFNYSLLADLFTCPVRPVGSPSTERSQFESLSSVWQNIRCLFMSIAYKIWISSFCNCKVANRNLRSETLALVVANLRFHAECRSEMQTANQIKRFNLMQRCILKALSVASTGRSVWSYQRFSLWIVRMCLHSRTENSTSRYDHVLSRVRRHRPARVATERVHPERLHDSVPGGW